MNNRCVRFTVVISAVLCSSVWALDISNTDIRSEHVPGQVIVKLYSQTKQASPLASATIIAQRHGEASVKALLNMPIRQRNTHGGLDSVFVFDYGESADIRGLIEQLVKDPEVVYAEPNHICHVATTPDDPFYDTTGAWGQSYQDMWGLHKVGLGPVGSSSGWDIETGMSNPVVVAVIDTGLDHDHPDMVGRVWTNPGEIPENGIDDDGNGFVDDTHGWDFANNDNSPDDGHGHGTHCSGTIAANTNNSIGVAGMSWGATIMPLKGLNDSGSGSLTALANALIYAADNGAKVLSNSWGGIDIYGGTETLKDACVYAESQGCLIVAAAANSGTDLYPPFPASYPEVLAVAATDSEDVRAYFSNFGPFVEISAPGVDILSLRSEGTDMYHDGGTHVVGTNYFRANGTSMSCPHVAGAAALIWSAHPEFVADEVRDHLVKTADDIHGVNSDMYPEALGTGRLNVHSALAITPRPLVRFRAVEVIDDNATHPNTAADPGETISLLVSVRNTWLPASQVHVTITNSDSFITINDGTADYGPVDADEVKANEADVLEVFVSPSCPLGQKITFDIQIEADSYSWDGQFSITVPGPELTTVGRIVLEDDGDNDHTLEAGETGEIAIRLRNKSRAGAARNVTATLSTSSSYVSILQASADYPNIPAGATGVNATSPFVIKLDPAFPADHVADCTLTVNSDGYNDVLPFTLSLPNATRFLNMAPAGIMLDPVELDVEMDVEGRIHAAWIQPDSTMNQQFATHRVWENDQWLPGEYLSESWLTPYSVDLAMDSMGQAHVTWEESGVIFVWGIPLTIPGAYYRGQEGDYWGPQTNVSNTPGSVEGVRESLIAVDSSDQVHAVWQFNHFVNGGSVDQKLYHNRKINGIWQPPVPIVINPTMLTYREMKLVPTNDGQLYLVYAINTPGNAFYRKWNGSNWSAQLSIPTDGIATFGLDSEVDSGNRLHVVYRDSGRIQVIHRMLDNGAWTAPHTVQTLPDVTLVDNVNVHVDDHDVVHVMWTEQVGPNADSVRTQRLSQGIWSSSETLVNTGAAVYEFDVVVDKAQRRHIFFTKSSKGLFHKIVDDGFLPIDLDGDGVAGDFDNCPLVSNADQSDHDGDFVGDVCDNCQDTLNANQTDTDGDGLGDVCDGDLDGDGRSNNEDNCPNLPNSSQADEDGDGVGDVCDVCPDTPAGVLVDETGCPMPVPADFDNDFDIDQEDFGMFQACLSGPGIIQADPDCARALIDADDDVDVDDLVLFQACMSGPNVPANPNCAN